MPKPVQQEVADTMVEEEPESPAVIMESVDSQSDAEGMYGEFAEASSGENRFVMLENNLLKLTISSLGGRIYSAELKEYNTWDAKPLKLFDGDSSYFGLNFFANNRTISTNDMFFTPDSEEERSVAGRRTHQWHLFHHWPDRRPHCFLCGRR